MGKIYSQDLRKRVLESYQGGLSSYQVAYQFDVSHDFVSDLVNLYAKTGSIEPFKRGSRKPPLITGENLQWLKEKLLEKNDYTISELSELVKKEKSIIAGKKAISGALKRLGFSIKKKCFLPVREIEKMSKKKENNL